MIIKDERQECFNKIIETKLRKDSKCFSGLYLFGNLLLTGDINKK